MLDKKFLYPLLFVIVLLIFLLEPGKESNLFIEATFLMNALLSIYFLFKYQEYPYSLQKIFYIFTFFFFVIGPFIQYKNNVIFQGNKVISPLTYLILNIFIFFIILTFHIVYHNKFFKQGLETSSKIDTESVDWSFKLKIILLVIAAVDAFFILYINNFNLFMLLLRGSIFSEDRSVSLSQVADLLVSYFIRPMPLIIFLFYFISSKRNIGYLFILGFLAVFTLAPTAVARLQAAALYIPIFILMVPLFSKKNFFIISMIFGLLIIFPFLDNFRKFDSDKSMSFGLNFEMFQQLHFDAYQNFMLVIENDFITYGHQLLGPLFFYVPRGLWENKPVGSGAFIAEKLNFSWTNIAMSFPAEGYINFGFIGMILFIILLAYACAFLDKRYWNSNFITSTQKIQYLILLGMLFFVLRGDLLSGTAYSIGLMMCVYTIGKIINFFKEKDHAEITSN